MDLTAEEVRVLGSLIEKGATTPDQYPLSTNSLRLACNQSTSRDPVVDYSERLVDATMLSLRQRGLARTTHGAGQRVAKHRHVAGEALGLDDAELAVVAVLALRGPQTAGELKARTERYAPDEHPFDIDRAIDRLVERAEPLVARLDKRPGEREARVAQLLSGEPDVGSPAPSSTGAIGPAADGEPTGPTRLDRMGDLERRVDELTAEVAALRSTLAELVEQLGG